MLIVQDVFDLIIHGFIFSYSLCYLIKKEKISMPVLIAFTCIFAFNKYIYLIIIPSHTYFLISNILISLILSYFLIHKTHLLSLFYSLSICIAYYSSLIFSQIIQNFIFHYDLHLSPILSMIVSETIFLFITILILENIQKISFEFSKNKHLILSILSLILVIFLMTIRIISKNYTLRYDIYLLLIIIIFLTLFLLILFTHMTHLEKQNYQELLTNQELLLKEKTFLQIERSVENLSALRHDLLYNLTHIQHLNHHENKDIDDFIHQQIKHIQFHDKPILTGNQTLNYIIFENINYIKENKIDFVCNQCHEDIPFQKIDFYTIMSSLLETAIHSVPNGSQINLKHGFIANSYYIKIIVPASVTIEIKEKKIIESILSKYNGNIYVTHENDFTEMSIFV